MLLRECEAIVVVARPVMLAEEEWPTVDKLPEAAGISTWA
jgi:hypothetical protein